MMINDFGESFIKLLKSSAGISEGKTGMIYQPQCITISHMKILVVNWQDRKNPRAGGAEVHLHDFFGRIAAMGHEVTLLASGFKGAPRKEVIDGIKVYRFGGRNYFNFVLPFVYWTKFHRKKFDVLVLDINKIPFFTLLLERKPKVGIAHHLFGKSIFLEVPPPMALYVYLTEMIFFKLAKNVPFVAVSPSTAEELKKRGIKQVKVIYNCVDRRKFRTLGIPKTPHPSVTYLGRITKYKSIDHLVDAFRIVKLQIPEAKLTIVGEGPYRKKLMEYAEGLDVVFTGFVSEEEKVEILNRSWVVVNPSVKEGWGLTVIEANACGTPVIAANSPGLRDSVKHNITGILYPYGDIQKLASEIVRVLRDEDLRNRLTQNALEWSRRFDCDKNAEELLKFLKFIKDNWSNLH